MEEAKGFKVKPTITTILFDLGGVIINIDYDATVNAFKKLGLDDFENQFSQTRASNFFIDFETGKVTESDFYEYVRIALNSSLSDRQIEGAWNAMLLDIPYYRIELLNQLSDKFNILLLSNTNIVHFKAFNEQFKQVAGVGPHHLFNKAYFSHEIGQRKPDRSIYEFVLSDADLKASEILFIDDTIANVIAAQEAGLEVCFLPKGHDIIEIDWGVA